MLPEALLILVPFGLLIAGIAILWAQSRALAGRREMPARWATALVSTVGWTLLVVGLFGTVALLAQALFLVAWIVTAVVLISLLVRYRSMERRSLLWTLMTAAERGIPLETAARAFAAERRDHIGGRTLDLAEYLEAGLPLALALKRSRLSFPPAVLLAADLGQQTGDLGGALRQALSQTDETEALLRSAAGGLFYLGFLVLFGLSIWIFLIMKIVPVFVKVFSDFGSQLPTITILLVDLSDFLVQFWPLAMLVLAILLFVLVRSLTYYTGYSPRYLPGLTMLPSHADRGTILRWLAVAVRQNRPLADMMRLLSGYIAHRGLRRKLEAAAKRIQQGADWTDSLRQSGLVRKTEAVLFQSAERAGNLAWALDQIAQSNMRRSIYRVRAVINVAFPAAVLVVGGTVLFVAVAFLAPLFSLIQNLT